MSISNSNFDLGIVYKFPYQVIPLAGDICNSLKAYRYINHYKREEENNNGEQGVYFSFYFSQSNNNYVTTIGHFHPSRLQGSKIVDDVSQSAGYGDNNNILGIGCENVIVSYVE